MRDRDDAHQREENTAAQMRNLQKILLEKQSQYDAMSRDFQKAQERQRTLMGNEAVLATSNDALQAKEKTMATELEKMSKIFNEREGLWQTERAEMQQKIKEMNDYVDKVKDECLKKIVSYKEKYTDYKSKVKDANKQISALTQRVALYEMQREHQ